VGQALSPANYPVAARSALSNPGKDRSMSPLGMVIESRM
jgi:hypothetical protein